MRYLIRISNAYNYTSDDREALSKKIKETIGREDVKTVNLRVTGRALEVDLFTDAEQKVEYAISKLAEIGSSLTVRRLDSVSPIKRSREEILQEAKKYFNEERFWEVHETLEDLWRIETGMERELLQGLILYAAAYVHQQRARYERVIPVLERALAKIEASGIGAYDGFDLKKIKEKGAMFLKTGKMTPFRLDS
ncbi:MAG: DUF309 domain-containing protein [Thaumarchaeota archaeon]|nr:DUF309 domain-containing protein [Nitrososphaerota archaeon]